MSLAQTLEEQARKIAAMEEAHLEELTKAYRRAIVLGSACLAIGFIIGILV